MNSAVGSLTYAAPEVLEAKEKQGYTAACDPVPRCLKCFEAVFYEGFSCFNSGFSCF